jgi:hypothetical protein
VGEDKVSFRLDLPLYITIDRSGLGTDEAVLDHAYELVSRAVARIGDIRDRHGELSADQESGDVPLQPWNMEG